ncbi:MAG: DUF86 domain-containing protein [Candidatus Harrisonbacteria bacterium]|nr:DUF86 domain-containing protein [Candidatus Harrisonbacteria bacterium]MBI2406146.1 DUF86 domain-containing protein [Candidatus Harrisonbacteria bacterium]
MSSRDVIENKISYIRKYLSLARKLQSKSREEIENDTVQKAALERYLYLIAQAVIDLAEAVVAFKKFRKPTTIRESIEILGEEGVLPPSFVREFIKIAGFRNVLAHEYGDLDFEIVYNVLKNKLKEVDQFLAYIEKI